MLFFRRYVNFVIFFLCFSALAKSAAQTNTWGQFLTEIEREALAIGVKQETITQAFKKIKQNPKIIKSDKNQPQKRLKYSDYQRSRVDALRIKLGKKNYKRYHQLLRKIEQDYGVDACVITAIWGLESAYGKYLGKYYTIEALANLAYGDRRAKFFRNELLYGLKVLDEGHVSKKQFVGDWAGGMGQPQFMPSSFYRYAADNDRDGYMNIWTNTSDVLASIAKYLAVNHWKTGQAIAIPIVYLPPQYDMGHKGVAVKKRIADWIKLGVKLDNTHHLDMDSWASIVVLHGGGSYLLLPNFEVIQTYNKSLFYAVAVNYLAQEICESKKSPNQTGRRD